MQSAATFARANPNEGKWLTKAMGTTDTSYGNWYHRPCVEDEGIVDVPCSTMASTNAKE